MQRVVTSHLFSLHTVSTLFFVLFLNLSIEFIIAINCNLRTCHHA